MSPFVFFEIYEHIFKPQKKEDVFWGQLIFIDGNPGEDYWETTHFFPPTGDNVYLFINADDSGPTQQQNAFYAKIRDNYRKLEKKLKPFIYPKWQNVNPDKKKPSKFLDEFSVASVSIPAKDDPHWEMTFFSKSDKGHIYTATLQDQTPIRVSRHLY